MFPALGKQRHTATPLSVPPRRFLRPWGLAYRRRREQARHPGRLPHPSPAPSQPLKAEPRSGLGRLPRAPRVHACEAWPRAPHPTGSGYPLPAKLSLCPTSVTPLEAPPHGQDRRTIRRAGSAGIGIHSQVRERRFARMKRALKNWGTRRLPPPKTLPDRDRRSSTDPRRS
jgi:hypothetical protein